MGIRKGQMLLSGLVLLGLSLTALSLGFMEMSQSNPGEDIFNNVEQSVPNQVKTVSEKYSGRSFVENFQALSYNYRDRVSAAGGRVSYTVLAGEREDRSFNVYTANLGSLNQDVDLEINGETRNLSLSRDEIKSSSFNPSEGYNISVDTDYFSTSFSEYDNSFVLVHYRYSGDGNIRQDTYIG